jgi:hypothetical protein
MLRKLSTKMQQISKGWVSLLALVVFLFFTALVLPAQSNQAKRTSGGADSPDTSFFYTAPDLYQMAETYGEGGRQAYIRARFTFDLVWPLVYLAFLVTGISWVYHRAFPPQSAWQMANLVPVLATLFDYLENISTSLVMLRYPSLTPGVADLAGIITLVKWLIVFGSITLLLIGVLAGIYRWLRNRRKF